MSSILQAIYVKDKLTLIQNCTVNRYLRISNPHCFLATCLYGPASEEVAVLKRFRDNILLDSALLSRFVALYYHLSPLAVRWLGDKRFFKDVLLVLTKPVISCIDWYLRGPRGKC